MLTSSATCGAEGSAWRAPIPPREGDGFPSLAHLSLLTLGNGVQIRLSTAMGKRSTASTAFGIVDLALAALYAFLILRVVPSRSMTFTVVALAASALLAAGGVGMIVQSRLGLVIAAIAASSMVAATFALILLLVASAAYLHGIYDGIGQAGAALAIIAALLAVEVVGLVPVLQLVHLWRRSHEGR